MAASRSDVVGIYPNDRLSVRWREAAYESTLEKSGDRST